MLKETFKVDLAAPAGLGQWSVEGKMHSGRGNEVRKYTIGIVGE